MAYSFVKGILIFVMLGLLTACYRMPTEHDYCVVPTTNNPDITREKSDCGWQPNFNN